MLNQAFDTLLKPVSEVPLGGHSPSLASVGAGRCCQGAAQDPILVEALAPAAMACATATTEFMRSP